MVKYEYEIQGGSSDGDWTTSGTVIAGTSLIDAIDAVMADSFNKLTQGKAVFGKPGVGCRGPYDMKKITVSKTGGDRH